MGNGDTGFLQITGDLFALALMLAFMIFGISAIPALIRELIFYNSNNWDLSKDSQRPMAFQASFVKKFEKMSVGQIKLRALVTRIVMGAMPTIIIVGSFIRYLYR